MRLRLERDRSLAPRIPEVVVSTHSAPPYEMGVMAVSTVRSPRRASSLTPWTMLTLAMLLVSWSVLGGCGSTKATTPSSTGRAVASQVVIVTLPVRKLVTEGDAGMTYASHVTVRVPASVAKQLAAYGVAGVVLVGPRGWTAVPGESGVGASGAGVTLEAGPSSALQGNIGYTMIGGVDNVWRAGASYFPWVRSHWSQSGLSGSVPRARRHLTKRFISDRVVTYTARGPEITAGFSVKGVACVSSLPPGVFTQLEVTLPSRDVDLADAILSYFMATRGGSRPVPSATTTPAEAPTPAATSSSIGRVGDTFTIASADGNDKTTVRLVSVRDYTKPRDATLGQAPAHGEYAVCDMSVQVLSGSLSVNPLYFAYQAPNGRTYDMTDGNAWTSGYNDPQLDTVTLSAGQHTRGYVVFDVPRGSTGADLQMKDGLSSDVVAQWNR